MLTGNDATEIAAVLAALNETGGLPVQPLDGRAKALMLDLLTAKNIEGVYAL